MGWGRRCRTVCCTWLYDCLTSSGTWKDKPHTIDDRNKHIREREREWERDSSTHVIYTLKEAARKNKRMNKWRGGRKNVLGKWVNIKLANRFASLAWTSWLLRRTGRERPLSHFLSYFSLLATLTPGTREEKAEGEERKGGGLLSDRGWFGKEWSNLSSAALTSLTGATVGWSTLARPQWHASFCWFVVTSHPNRIRNVIPPCNCQTQHHYARSQQYQEHKIYGLQKQQ